MKTLGLLALLLPLVAGFAPAPAQAGGQTVTVHALACPVDYVGTAYEADCAATQTSFLIGAADASPRDWARHRTDAGGTLTVGVRDNGGRPVVIAGDNMAGAPRVTCDDQGQPVAVAVADSAHPANGVVVSPGRPANEIACQYVYLPESGMADARPDRAMAFTISLCPEEYAGNDAASECAGNPVAGAALGVGANQDPATSWRVSNADGQLRFEIAGWQHAATAIEVMGRVPELVADAAGMYDDVAALRCRAGDAELETYATDAAAAAPVWMSALPAGGDVACELFLLPRRIAAPAPPNGERTLTIHNRLCPVDFAGGDWYAACHGTGIPDQTFSALGNVTAKVDATTDAAGNATFTRLPADRYMVIGGPPAELVRDTLIFCSATETPGVPYPLVELRPDLLMLTATVSEDDLLCDWYTVPVDAAAYDTLAG